VRLAVAPLVVELYCGTFGWSAGWLALGGRAVGFDLEHEAWHGPVPENASLVLQDVRTLHGSQFKDADLILGSSPCQEFSYRAMPWKRAKALGPPELGMELFHAQFRIQREASEAAGRHIPMVVENVCGAQKWVGRAAWHFGSYYLWGDVPALMPHTTRAVKVGGTKLSEVGFNVAAVRAMKTGQTAVSIADAERQLKNTGGSWFNVAHNTTSGKGQNPDGRKQGGEWWHDSSPGTLRSKAGNSNARRAASALIARIPDRLSSYIAECYWPSGVPSTGGEA
jgi:hypothetical protein